MTRWARAGNAQKHKKLPGDATKWGEFDLQQTNSSAAEQVGVKRKKDSNRKEKTLSVYDFSSKKIAYSNEYQKSNDSQDRKNISNIELKDAIKSNEKASSSRAAIQLSSTNEQEESSLSQTISVKKLKNKKKEILKQNDIDSKIPKDPHLKAFEKKKNRYLEKLKKKRSENGILLLPAKVERKLYNIKRRLRDKRMPPAMIKDIIRKERRKEELKFRKTFNPSKLCFNCRQPGHMLADCPVKLSSSYQETGLCFKCGASEHTSFKCPEKVQGFPFAKCFICKEQGHISRDCPRNKHGVYPKGGRCNLCGNVNHLKKDCPSLSNKNEESTMTLPTIKEAASIDAEISEIHSKSIKGKKPKIVKF